MGDETAAPPPAGEPGTPPAGGSDPQIPDATGTPLPAAEAGAADAGTEAGSVQPDATDARPQRPAPGGLLGTYGSYILVFALFYLLLIRPERTRKRERQALLSALKKNDKVVTAAGIHGTVTSLHDEEVTLRVDDDKDVKIRVSRSAITTVHKAGEKTT